MPSNFPAPDFRVFFRGVTPADRLGML